VHPQPTLRDLLTADVGRAADLLRHGGLVALPTETVYGLGALATDPDAVARVFTVKGRPASHPLIVHLAGVQSLDAWARDVPGYARRLAERLWPGPLTLVLPRTVRAGDHVTGGQDTVGLRVPDHPVAHALLTAVDGLAGPSANRFGRVSPTTPEHVLDELGALLDPARDAVLDGGSAVIGLESTILDCTGDAPVLLRPGAVTAAQVAAVGGVPLADRSSAVRAPGTLSSHYAPHAAVVLVEPGGAVPAAGSDRVGLLAPASVPTPAGYLRLAEPVGDQEYARVLYAALRQADAFGLTRVVAVLAGPDGLGPAIDDRLRRAAHGSAG
jgi:L-threonylcarbamoyladenylate synthase